MHCFCSAQQRRWMRLSLAALVWAVSSSMIAMAARASTDQQAESSTHAPTVSLECPEGTVVRAARALHFFADGALWDSDLHSACRLDPAHGDRAIVALAYMSGEERNGKPDEGNQAGRDLDIVIMQLGDDAIIAHGHWGGEIQDDAERLEGIAIDTGRYILAENKRAFGIRTTNSTHCSCFNSSHGDLMLFVQSEDHLDLVLQASVDGWESELDGTEESRPICSRSSVERRSTLVVSRRSSHGMFDLNELIVEQPRYESDEVTAKCPALPPEKTVMTWQFDGHEYKQLKSGHAQ